MRDAVSRIGASARAGATRHERVLWIAVLAVALVIQWPMLKGLYYRASGSPAPASSIAWRTDLDGALVEAKRTNRQVLVDFTADWCPPCIVMKHEVWPDPAVARAVADRYVPLLVDVDRNGAVAELYKVTGIPTVLVLDASGGVVRHASFLSSRSAAAMTAFLTDTE